MPGDAGGWTPTRREPGLRATRLREGAALLLAVLGVVVAGSALPGDFGPGIGVAAIGLGAAVVFYALNRPVLAVGLLLFTTFLRMALRTPALPAEPAFFAMALVVAAAAIAVTRRVHQAPQFGAVEGAMAVYVIWNIGSAIAPHRYPADGGSTIGEHSSIYHFILTGTVVPFMCYVVGRFVFDRPSAVRSLLWVVMGCYAYSIWVSIAQFAAPALVWPRYILDYPEDASWAHRAVGVFSQPVVNGLMLIIGFALAVHLAYQPDTRRWQRILLCGLMLSSLAAIYLTYTRVVWLGFALFVGAAAVLIRRTRPVYVSLIGAMLLGVAANWATFTSSDRSAGGVGSSYEVEDRLNMIATAFWAIREKPLLGWGIGRFSEVNTYHHQQWSQEVSWKRGFGIVSHFNELGIAAELGIIGLALWLTINVLLARGLWQALLTLPAEGIVGRELAVIVSIIFGVWILTGFTADLRFFDFLALLILMLVGIVVGTAQRLALVERLPVAAVPPDAADDLVYLRSS
ncbi:O-antigen ligase family protein [Pseudonocardia sp. H11422]|uniref:O-antigen ligase family protein n=1 Tax=Pseudonocardia sp. H11422 TaxID=2835866 RepID=UPI0020284B31|nr:O-antigen ligase family protein [Pseudonocardia sp. H11422]